MVKKYTIIKRIAKHGNQSIIVIPRVLESQLKPGAITQVTIEVLDEMEEGKMTKKKNKTGIIGTGIYLPDSYMSNQVLESSLGLEDGFIEKRTGIKERRWPYGNLSVEYMAAEATLNAVRDAGIKKLDSLIVVRDLISTKRAKSIGLPVMERLNEEGIDVSECYSVDISNYCPGFIHGMNLGTLQVDMKQAKNIAVVASTRYADVVELNKEFNEIHQDGFSLDDGTAGFYSLGREGEFQAPRMNAFLWGNGAGAFVIGENEKRELDNYKVRTSKRTRYNAFGIGESKYGNTFGSLDGGAIYTFGVEEVPGFLNEFLRKKHFSSDDKALLIAHQPQPRMLKGMIKQLEFPNLRVPITCDTLGNMIGASIPVTYHLEKEAGRVNADDAVIFCSFGDSYLTVAAIMEDRV